MSGRCGGGLPCERTTGQDAPVFKAESDLVVLHVNVFDRKSDAVPNLPQTCSTSPKTTHPQQITFFSSEDVPVAVGLIVDNSGSMITRRPMVLAGTKAFAESSHPEDELFTIVFNEHVRHGLPDTVAVHTEPRRRSKPRWRASRRAADGAARRGDCRPRAPGGGLASEARARRALGRRGQRQPAVRRRHARARRPQRHADLHGVDRPSSCRTTASPDC